jgi:hypothetical protein
MTTTRSTQRWGKRSQACQSRMQPPGATSGSRASRSCFGTQSQLHSYMWLHRNAFDNPDNSELCADTELHVEGLWLEAPAHLILIHNPCLQFLIPILVAVMFFGYLVNGEVLEARVPREELSVCGLPDTGRPRDYDIRIRSHHGYEG